MIKILLNEFDYFLPENLIAQKPVEPRNFSRLMILNPNTKKIMHEKFYNLKNYLNPGDTLIFNDTRVIPARLIGKKSTGARVEIFLLRQIDGTTWETLVKPGRKILEGTEIFFSEELTCEILSRTDYGGRIVKFKFSGIFEEILDKLGETPLPPYIHEKISDIERYQTVYNRVRGSAAAPTAGLHFTFEQMNELKNFGINLGFVTLHVGLGTFRPVQVEKIENHEMHEEIYTIPEKTAELIHETKIKGKKIIAVGTTSVRTLESAAIDENFVKIGSDTTKIFIYPGYKFKIIDGMITNFHLPKSTLIMLVSAFAGKNYILDAYKVAVEEKYRFFSFGDAMFITEKIKN